jgi:riboflavin synthase
MTLTRIEPEFYEFFMMEESLRVTTFWTKKVWDRVNVERSLKVWDRIDGHIVTGHVDVVWKVILLDKIPDSSLIIGIEYPQEYMRFIIQKGSITVNGTSLTVVEDRENIFTVSLIPLTQDWTNLWTLQIWDLVNLEFDMMAKYMLKNLELRT